MFGVRQGDVRGFEMEQLIRSMGQHQLKFASLYGGQTPQVRGPFFFYVLKGQCHETLYFFRDEFFKSVLSVRALGAPDFFFCLDVKLF